MTIAPFDGEDEVLAYANGVEYGLSATIWTQDIRRANRLATQIDAGIVWINTWLLRDLRTPFGGVKAVALAGKVVGKPWNSYGA